MKQKKNILLLIGAVLAIFPFGVYMLTRFGGYIKWLSALTSEQIAWFFSLVVLNAVFFSAEVILAILQLRNNCKRPGKRIIPIIGIVLSGLYLAYYIFSILSNLSNLPSGLLYNHLGLLSIVVELFLDDLAVVGPVGHILLIIGYARSLPDKN